MHAVLTPLRMKWSILLVGMLLAGCTASHQPRVWLDERTAATITAQNEPIVFAHDEQMRAANVRDYAQLGAIEVNRMGERARYLVIVYWSTIDRPTPELERHRDSFTRIRIQADDRPIVLQRLEQSNAQLGVLRRPFRWPVPSAREAYFEVEPEELRAIALSRRLTLSAEGIAEVERRYEVWDDARAALTRFLASLPH